MIVFLTGVAFVGWVIFLAMKHMDGVRNIEKGAIDAAIVGISGAVAILATVGVLILGLGKVLTEGG